MKKKLRKAAGCAILVVLGIGYSYMMVGIAGSIKIFLGAVMMAIAFAGLLGIGIWLVVGK